METVIKPQKALSVKWKEMWRFRELFYIFAWRDIKVRYKQTVVGGLWAILQPFVTMIIFTLLFNKVAKISSGDIPYPVFSYSGLIFWNYFSNAMNNASNSIVNNQAMITKIYFPRIILPVSSTIASLTDFFFAFIVFVFISFYYKIVPGLAGLLFLLPMLALALFTALGVGMFFGALNVKYRDIRQALPFLTQLLLFLTPVIYPATLIPEKFQWILFLNPITGVITVMRAGLLGQGAVPWSMIGLSAVMGFVALVVGFSFFRAKEREFADVI